MKILLLGSGGREHALAWKMTQSRKLKKLYIAPGNGGMHDLGDCIDLDVTEHEKVIDFIKLCKIDLVVIGPEAPLVDGLADALEAANIKVFGPKKAAAQLEGSKSFTKKICKDHDIPTAKYGHFDNPEEAIKYVQSQGTPIVIKADGLAAGKGVIMAQTMDEAITAIQDCFDGSFGAAGAEVVIEETLYGQEASFFVLTDGVHCLPLATAQDHKRAFDGDKGPNTGGMGAYSPAPVMTDELIAQTMATIIEPTVKALKDQGTPYKGVLYAGLMITNEGPKLIEYNARFGDPECQVLMMRLNSDIIPALEAVATGTLDKIKLDWNENPAITVVMTAKGYPGPYQKGDHIIGVATASHPENIEIFHAGTDLIDGKTIAVGGRVLNVTTCAPTLKDAQKLAYDAIKQIDWPDAVYRTDIGWRAL